VQFSLFRLLLATTAFGAMLGLAKLLGFGKINSVVVAAAVGGIVLLVREKGLRTSEQIAGFSPQRVAWATAFLSVALVPAHFFVSCEMSAGLGFAAFTLLLVTGGLSCVGRDRKSAGPFLLAILGLIAHMFCAH
jgi:hypothetical protein